MAVAVAEHVEMMNAAYAEVRSGDTDIEWIILEYTESNKLTTYSKGKGKENFCKHFDKTKVLYGYLRVDEGDTTVIITVMWVGSMVSEERKSKACDHCKNCREHCKKEWTSEQVYVEATVLTVEMIENYSESS